MTHVDKDIKREELSRIYKKYGGLKASIVLKEAEKKTSPLHDDFLWDDEAAAHEYRLVQARTLIKRIGHIVIEGRAEILVHVPSTIREEGVYEIGSIVAKSEDAFERALAEAQTKLLAAKRAVLEIMQLQEPSVKKQKEKYRVALRAIETARDALAS